MYSLISEGIVGKIMPFIQKTSSTEMQPSLVDKLTNARNLPKELKQQYKYEAKVAKAASSAYTDTDTEIVLDFSSLSVGMKQKLRYTYASESISKGENFIEVGTKYYHNEPSNSGGGILETCHNEIARHIRWKKRLTSFSHGPDPFDNYKSLSVKLDIYSPNLNKNTLNIIFKSFNTVFKNDETDERLLVAKSAYTLMQYFLENEINNVSENDIIKCITKYLELLETGCEVAGYITI